MIFVHICDARSVFEGTYSRCGLRQLARGSAFTALAASMPGPPAPRRYATFRAVPSAASVYSTECIN